MVPTEKKLNAGSIIAHASWAVVVLWGVANTFLRAAGLAVIGDLLAILTILGAFVLAVAALVSIKRYGRRGILIPALIGLFLSLLMLLIFVPNMLAGIERGRAMRDAAATPGYTSPSNKPFERAHSAVTPLAAQGARRSTPFR